MKNIKIEELERDVHKLRKQHEELTNRLVKQHDHLVIEERQDLLQLEGKMQQETRKMSATLKNELDEMRSESKTSKMVSSGMHSSEYMETSEFEKGQGLSTSELLTQLIAFSDDEANEKAIKVLVASLSEKYQQELIEYESQSGQLKETV